MGAAVSRVEGGDRDAGVDSVVDERGHAGVAGDGGNGIVFLGHGGFDAAPKMSAVWVSPGTIQSTVTL